MPGFKGPLVSARIVVHHPYRFERFRDSCSIHVNTFLVYGYLHLNALHIWTANRVLHRVCIHHENVYNKPQLGKLNFMQQSVPRLTRVHLNPSKPVMRPIPAYRPFADACRSMGIPARIVGMPLWTEVRGNHNWVEVWNGQWHNVGGTGSDPRDDDWVNKRCITQTDSDHWRHTVYTAWFRQTSLRFPLVWDDNSDYSDALNVTRFYAKPQEPTIDIPGEGQAVVAVFGAGELIAHARGEKQVHFTLASGSVYQIQIITADG